MTKEIPTDRHETSSVSYPGGRRPLRGRIHFKEYCADNHYGKLMSKQFHNGDWHWWFVIDWCLNEDDNDYLLSLSVVAPEAAPENELFDAVMCCGYADDELNSWFTQPHHLVEALADYGLRTTIASWKGPNLKRLLCVARDEADGCRSLFGFYMDRPRNGFGATGWDIVAGNPWGAHKMDRVPVVRERPAIEQAVRKILVPLQKKSKKIQEAQG
jgi:hypothetical protein